MIVPIFELFGIPSVRVPVDFRICGGYAASLGLIRPLACARGPVPASSMQRDVPYLDGDESMTLTKPGLSLHKPACRAHELR